MYSRYFPFSVATPLSVDLSVNGVSLLQMPREVLQKYLHAWEAYIPRLMEQGAQNESILKLAALGRLRRAFASLFLGAFSVTIADAEWVLTARKEAPREVNSAHLLRAYAYSDTQQYELALCDWDYLFDACNALSTSTDSWMLGMVSLERGLIYAELANYSKAIEDCNRAERCGHVTPKLFSARGLARGYIGDEQRALLDCERALEIAKTPDGYYQRARLYCHLERFDEAFADFERALSLAPDAEDIRSAFQIAQLRAKLFWLRQVERSVLLKKLPGDTDQRRS